MPGGVQYRRNTGTEDLLWHATFFPRVKALSSEFQILRDLRISQIHKRLGLFRLTAGGVQVYTSIVLQL